MDRLDHRTYTKIEVDLVKGDIQKGRSPSTITQAVRDFVEKLMGKKWSGNVQMTLTQADED